MYLAENIKIAELCTYCNPELFFLIDLATAILADLVQELCYYK